MAETAEIWVATDVTDIPSPFMTEWGNTSVYASVREACASVKNKAVSLLNRFKNPKKSHLWDGSNGGDGSNGDSMPSGESWKWYSARILNTMAIVSFGVACATWGAMASQTSNPANKLASDALHAVWYSGETVHDKYSSLSSQNSSLKELATQATQAEKRAIKENTWLKTTNEELIKKDKTLAKKYVTLTKENRALRAKLWTKISHKKGRVHISSRVNYKQIAEKRQKTIDAQLKKLLVLQGMKPVLKHEWVPDRVTNYKAYTEKQNKSLSIIKQKIAALQEKGISKVSVTKAPTGITHVKRHVPKKGLVRKTTVSKTPSKTGVVKPGNIQEKNAPTAKVIEDISKKVLPITSSMDEQLQSIVPEMKSPTLSSKTDDVVSNAPKASSAELDRSSTFELSGKGLDQARLGTAVPVLVSANGDTLNVPIEDMHRNSGWVPSGIALLMQSSPTQTVADKAPVTKKDSHKESSAVPTGLENVWNTPKPSSSFRLEKGSGLTPSNITEEKMTAFLDKANRKLRSVGATDPRVKDASFTMERVVKNGFPGWLITMKYKGGENHFILSTEKASWNYKNFQIVASPKRASNWAVHEATEREKRLEKKMAKQEKRGK